MDERKEWLRPGWAQQSLSREIYLRKAPDVLLEVSAAEGMPVRWYHYRTADGQPNVLAASGLASSVQGGMILAEESAFGRN